jgi:Flp pilus assembly protein TadG
MLTMRNRKPMLRLAGDERGVSAVEFALVAPLMIALYFGCVEISDGVSAGRKVSMVAASIANLTARVTSISSTEMTNVLDASATIVAPYSSSKLKVTVSCLNIDANQNVTVKWSATRNGTTRSSFSFDSSNVGLKVANSQLLYAEASYDYTPTVGYSITGTITLSDHMFMSPRVSAPTYNGVSCT